jgi:hypothetical protein
MEKRNRDATSRIEIDLVVRWLWYFIKYYETEEEINLSMELLNFYLKEEDQSIHFGETSEVAREKNQGIHYKELPTSMHRLF